MQVNITKRIDTPEGKRYFPVVVGPNGRIKPDWVMIDEDALAPIRVVLEQSGQRRWHHLAEERIQDVKPEIPLGKRFWALEKKERADIEELFQDHEVVTKILEFKGRKPETKISVVDAAYWMKGCSSLGRLRYAVLLGIGKKSSRSHCLIDLKEAATAAAPQSKLAIRTMRKEWSMERVSSLPIWGSACWPSDSKERIWSCVSLCRKTSNSTWIVLPVSRP